jgi:hypothetical protein
VTITTPIRLGIAIRIRLKIISSMARFPSSRPLALGRHGRAAACRRCTGGRSPAIHVLPAMHEERRGCPAAKAGHDELGTGQPFTIER